jgi:ABC-2 type transport system ATP-binding protein
MKDDNRLIVYTSHYMNEVESLCDKIAIIDHGKIIQEGNLNSILSDSKAVVKTSQEVLEVDIALLSDTLARIVKEGQRVESIEYGHNLESYFLQMTDTQLRD